MINYIVIRGNLVAPPTRTGSGPVILKIASTQTCPTQKGGTKEETCFIDVEAWDELGYDCMQRLQKGSPVLVQGRIKLNRWIGHNRRHHERHFVLAANIEFLPKTNDIPQGPPSFGEGLASSSAEPMLSIPSPAPSSAVAIFQPSSAVPLVQSTVYPPLPNSGV